MSLQVLLTPPGGPTVEVTEYLADGRISLGRGLGGSGATCSFSLVNYPGVVSLAEVLVTWDGAPIYRGQVVRRKRTAPGDTVTILTPDCEDAVTRMRRRLVARIYEGQRADAIVADLLARYMPEVARVIPSLTAVMDMTYNYVTLEEAINRIAESTGADWLLHPNDTFRMFVETWDGHAVPVYDPANILEGSFTDEVANQAFANRVWVLGAKQAAESYKTQIFSGASSVFPLAYEPNYTQVKVNGVSRKVHLKENRQADTEFIVDKKRKAVESLISLEPSDTVEIRYRPTIEVVDYFEDSGSIRTYGLYETVIKDRKITDKAAARQRGRAALRRSATQRPVFSWQTDGEWDVYPGQRVRLRWPQWGIDQYCRLTDVGVNFQWLGDRWRVVASLTGEGL
ncbi:hypothetical protein [Symbiobacterium thermophilum]|uniref:Tail protein n=1 Tax=Symbiobacterium thermophilum TaxID=2734 RepID=A0A953LHV1_SYMTR|nr:hypothetical protein [Symbiobacterium thermophilum]MBY6277688.1 hypothetical protein [Symbiobacterium thermophilum]